MSLVLGRKKNQSIIARVNNEDGSKTELTITVQDIRSNKNGNYEVKLALDAPKSIEFIRKEIDGKKYIFVFTENESGDVTWYKSGYANSAEALLRRSLNAKEMVNVYNNKEEFLTDNTDLRGEMYK